jgi:hypothetical protein
MIHIQAKTPALIAIENQPFLSKNRSRIICSAFNKLPKKHKIQACIFYFMWRIKLTFGMTKLHHFDTGAEWNPLT